MSGSKYHNIFFYILKEKAVSMYLNMYKSNSINESHVLLLIYVGCS